MLTCLEVRERLAPPDRQRSHALPFTVPIGVAGLRLRFWYGPGEVDGWRNLLTLSLFDPTGFRGAAHRWATEQVIELGSGGATPGFLPGPIQAGPWAVSIDAHEILDGGCELGLQVEVEGDGTGGDPAPQRLSRQAALLHHKPGWYRGDLHCHSIHCDGASGVREMAEAAAGRGLDFLAMTCHNTTSWMYEGDAGPDPLLVVRGMECTTFFGHANVLGISAWLDWRTTGRAAGLGELTHRARAQGALLVVTHPCALGNPACSGCRWEYLADLGQVEGLEVWNSAWTAPDVHNPAALELWTELLEIGCRVTGVAGTDSHEAGRYADWRLPATWVYARGLGERALLEGLRRGRVILSSGPLLDLVLETPTGRRPCLPGDRLPLAPFGLVVSVAELGAPATLWLVGEGGLRRAASLRPPGGLARFEAVEVRRWCRLELRAGDDPKGEMLALANPLYAG